ncbi:hypothetical protein LEMLEM_LOCUS15947, partial [Lemmus lemmus]
MGERQRPWAASVSQQCLRSCVGMEDTRMKETDGSRSVNLTRNSLQQEKSTHTQRPLWQWQTLQKEN